VLYPSQLELIHDSGRVVNSRDLECARDASIESRENRTIRWRKLNKMAIG
jgi:hypothetical protein